MKGESVYDVLSQMLDDPDRSATLAPVPLLQV